MGFFYHSMKLGYHDPRPFWVDPEIEAFDFSTSYGNPSGHSTKTFGLSILLWLDFAHTDHKWWLKILLLPCAICWGVSVMYSRLFLGVHTID